MAEINTRGRGGLIAAATIGVGLGGFFDGILLHQVLQWHHLLSLVAGEAFRDLGTQILADGLFHVAMYVVTVSGLWLLWRRRNSLGNHQTVAGGGLLGFGLWNVADVGLFHWILGIHRIRIDVPDPMTYDLAWLAVFGLAPLAVAWFLLRRPGGPNGAGGRGAAAALSSLAVIAAPLAALPPRDTNTAVAFFRPGSSPAAAINAAVASNAAILWIDPAGRMIAVRLPGPDATAALYGAGALLVTRSPAIAGCAAAVSA